MEEVESKVKFDWRGIVAIAVGILLAYAGLPGIGQVWCVAGAIVVRIVLNCIGRSPAKIYQA